MERVREAIQALDPQEAYLVSDRAVEVLLRDGRTVRITAYESLKSGGYSAVHEVEVEFEQDGKDVAAWSRADFPWAAGDSVEDCLAEAIFLMRSA
ncbi:MAG TPA: hypothetical protein VG144_10080 [Gaiellaceae bacterium]|nr:hypothetical protein [Gaiellaceae bacterium]